MVDKIIEALKDWRFYIVFITFVIVIKFLDFQTVSYLFEKGSALIGS